MSKYSKNPSEEAFSHNPEHSKHTEKFWEIFPRITKNTPEGFKYSELHQKSRCSFFKSGYKVYNSSGIENNKAVFFQKFSIFLCPYFLKRRTCTIEKNFKMRRIFTTYLLNIFMQYMRPSFSIKFCVIPNKIYLRESYLK